MLVHSQSKVMTVDWILRAKKQLQTNYSMTMAKLLKYLSFLIHWTRNIIRRETMGLFSLITAFPRPSCCASSTEAAAHPGAPRLVFHLSLRRTIHSWCTLNSLKAITPEVNLADCCKDSALWFLLEHHQRAQHRTIDKNKGPDLKSPTPTNSNLLANPPIISLQIIVLSKICSISWFHGRITWEKLFLIAF